MPSKSEKLYAQIYFATNEFCEKFGEYINGLQGHGVKIRLSEMRPNYDEDTGRRIPFSNYVTASIRLKMAKAARKFAKEITKGIELKKSKLTKGE